MSMESLGSAGSGTRNSVAALKGHHGARDAVF